LKLHSKIPIRGFLLFLLIPFSCAVTDSAQDRKDIHSLMDSWHKAAATADEDVFFGSMTQDCIYLGTDQTEKWKRDELKEWSKKFFDRETAWSFTPFEREIYFSEDGQTAWFDEKLDTWMGLCRGSGILIKTPEGWKLSHYNLAVTVPNEKINGFIELVKGK
jgi:ketosteroid isomerase-like protein